MRCLICEDKLLDDTLDVGEHPVSSFLRDDPTAPEARVALALGQCGRCGVIQLRQPVSYEKLVPPAFIAAREPEEHLDEVVEKILETFELGPESIVAGLTYKDDTTLERFERKGVKRTWRAHLSDFEIDNPAANIETVQIRTTPERMAAVAAKYGQADLLIVRHISEHTEDPAAFMQGLAALVKPGGLLMLEIPDCTKNLTLRDYCMIWEEHSLYLTPATYEMLPPLGGFESQYIDVHPLPFENCLVQIARKTGAPRTPTPSDAAASEIGLLGDYARGFAPACADLRRQLESMREKHGKIALFGAGHLACAFVNFMGVADLIEFVADDTPEKQGRYLPGSDLLIAPSSNLLTEGIAVCLLALSISNEDKVIARNQAFVDAGGRFLSIFRASTRSIFDADYPT
ncbi:MAG: class I SAM-dependent methyltransferase [Alphaproteobacteria bacterium]|nr:class I SAM-dependent methyltransferase [Alphaproteobacteria bacterium]